MSIGPPVLTPRSSRVRHLILIVALLPMLTYLGHWPAIEFPIPGTGAYWQLPFSEGWGTGHGEDGHSRSHRSTGSDDGNHAQHCHTDMGSCLHATIGAIAAAAILLASLAFIGQASRFVAWEMRAATPVKDWLSAPLTPPPQVLSTPI
jgi:hypothetical protein